VSGAPLFTVFTPTYNRAHTLKRVFDSLRAQTLRDFEWLVVDDGSTDKTTELIASWAKASDFPIRYFKQEHTGKHIAHNLAVREGCGKFFLPLDSDDACSPRALERFAYHWNTIPESERASFSGVVALCCDQYGKVVGDRFPSDLFDANWRDVVYVYRVRGEKWGPQLMELVRRYPFPQISGTHFVPEGLVWLDLAKAYKIRFVNEVLRTYYVEHSAARGSLTTLRKCDENAPGRFVYYIWLLNNDLSYFFNSPAPFLRAAVMVPILAWTSGYSFRYTIRLLYSAFAKALFVLALPGSALIFAIDRMFRWHGSELRRRR
jgi:glycosyltransferase involved in cell wall biosynthesis